MQEPIKLLTVATNIKDKGIQKKVVQILNLIIVRALNNWAI